MGDSLGLGFNCEEPLCHFKSGNKQDNLLDLLLDRNVLGAFDNQGDSSVNFQVDGLYELDSFGNRTSAI
jgi:hypothetical protein